MSTTVSSSPAPPINSIITAVYSKLLSVGNFMYGTKERTWMTLAITFAMLVTGISMMQSAGTGGACAF